MLCGWFGLIVDSMGGSVVDVEVCVMIVVLLGVLCGYGLIVL